MLGSGGYARRCWRQGVRPRGSIGQVDNPWKKWLQEADRVSDDGLFNLPMYIRNLYGGDATFQSNVRIMVSRLLRDKYGVVDFEYYLKDGASVATPPDVLADMATRCDAIIHAVAD